MKPIVFITAITALVSVNAFAEGYKVEVNDIKTMWGIKNKISVTSLFDFTTIYKIEVNRGNCEVAWPESPKVSTNKDKYSQSDELLANLSNPNYKKPPVNTSSNAVRWHPYPAADLAFGAATDYLTTTRCRVLEIDIYSSEGDYRFTAD